MSEAWEGPNKATCSYLANSPLVDHITFTNGSTTRMVSTRQHDFLNRLTNAVSTIHSVNFVRHNYSYNTASQRTENLPHFTRLIIRNTNLQFTSVDNLGRRQRLPPLCEEKTEIHYPWLAEVVTTLTRIPK